MLVILEGELQHRGIGGDPVVYIAVNDQTRLYEWWTQNSIFTQIMQHPHPVTGVQTPTIYVTNNAIGHLVDGDQVNVTIETRPEKRGNGIRILSVLASPNNLHV